MPKEIFLDGKGTLTLGDKPTLFGYPISFADHSHPALSIETSHVDEELYAIFSKAIDSCDPIKVKDVFREHVFSPYLETEREGITHKTNTSEELFNIAKSCVTPAPGTPFVFRSLSTLIRLGAHSPGPIMPDRY